MEKRFRQSDLRKGRFSEAFGIYLVTKCVADKGKLTPRQRSDVVGSLVEARQRKGILLYAFVVMPDHWHALFSVTGQKRLNEAVGFICRHSRFSWRTGADSFSWQEGFHDRKIRRDDSVVDIVKYIECNPLRKSLVSSVSEWVWSSAHAEHVRILDRSFLGYERWE